MKINQDHMYHGAALTQIAEHPRFTAINAFKWQGSLSRSSFKVNDEIGVYIKYATRPTDTKWAEYVFTFRDENLSELKGLAKNAARVYLALVCVKDKEICSLPYTSLMELIRLRREAKGVDESQYSVLLTLPKRSRFRVYVNDPGTRGARLGKEQRIPRNDFPGAIFQ
jgi:hypothetical protein